MGQRKMSKIDTSIIPGIAAGVVRGTAPEVRQFETRQFEVGQRGALPVAPLAMPSQILEAPRRGLSRFAIVSLAPWRRPSGAGR